MIVLGLAMDRPKIEDVVSSVTSLKELGSLVPERKENEFSKVDGLITPLGRMQVSKYFYYIQYSSFSWTKSLFEVLYLFVVRALIGILFLNFVKIRLRFQLTVEHLNSSFSDTVSVFLRKVL